jgi:hypothetical protein
VGPTYREFSVHLKRFKPMYRKNLRRAAASIPEILSFVSKFKKLVSITPMYYSNRVQRHVLRNLSLRYQKLKSQLKRRFKTCR